MDRHSEGVVAKAGGRSREWVNIRRTGSAVQTAERQ